MVTTIKNPTTGNVLPQFTMYKYDQLNRLRNMKAFAGFNFTNNEWNYSSYDGRYQNDFTYDANGNIETAVANNANGDVIDNQVYNYYKPGNNKQNNRLYSITDIAAITSGKDLPSGQIAFDNADLLNNNYRYNELGELVYDKQMGIDEITWGNNGKILTVTHSEASGKYNLKFDYNHTGKRIAKHVYNQNNTLLRSEYYTRDASDNVMAVYRLEVDEQNQEVSFRLKERHIYGSSMLGIDRLELELIDPIAPNNTLNHIVGLKSYTGSNHLGNVLTTFSDKKLPVDENSDGIIDYYQPHIISSSDYAPFGAQLAERSFFSETYPNSFNDKRDDPELGDWQDYGMRMYSTWQRRFPTPDPLIVYGQEYPWYSPYQFAGNKPIWAVDLDGLEELITNGKNNFEMKGVYVVEDAILSKYDINDLETAINFVANTNPLSIISPKSIRPDRVNLQFTISLMPMGKQLGEDGVEVEYDKYKDDRIWSKNGKSLGGVVKVGNYDDEMFIPKDGFEVYAYIKANEKTSSNEIIINPRVLDTPSKFPLFRFARILWHEKGHDMGLDHSEKKYPEFGVMSIGGGYPTDDEVKQLINPNGDHVTPSEELVK